MSAEIFNLTEAQFTGIRYFVSELSAETGMVIPPWSLSSSWHTRLNQEGEIEALLCWLSTVYLIKVGRDGNGTCSWGSVAWH